jgi:hypothetical protein
MPRSRQAHIASITRLRLNVAFAKIANEMLSTAKRTAPTKF